MAGMVTFDHLDIVEFVGGYLEMITLYENAVKSSMYDPLKLLMDKVIFHTWPSVRPIFAFCARQVELSRVSWHDSSYFHLTHAWTGCDHRTESILLVYII